MNYTPVQTEAPEKEAIANSPSIFAEIIDYSPLEKSMKQARIWLYVIAAIQLIMGLVEYNTAETKLIGWLAFGIDSGIGAIFLVLALWSKKKPALAFSIALGLYVLIHLVFMIMDPVNIYKGILLKVIVVVVLVKAVKNARQYEAIKNSVGERV